MADQDKPQGPVAIDSLPWSEWSRGVRFASRFRALSDTRNGGRKIGIAYEELPPGKQSVPFHYHLLEEEHIVALEGEATLRLGSERTGSRLAIMFAFPPGSPPDIASSMKPPRRFVFSSSATTSRTRSASIPIRTK